MSARAVRVLVCGDVINDIVVQARGPLAHGEDNPATIRRRPGGSAANQAVWMATLGLDVVFAGRVGAQDAEFHRRELARSGVEPHLAVDESAATGSIVVLVGPDGERTMITDRGANLGLRPADVPAALFDDVALLHLTGYSFFAAGPRAADPAQMAASLARHYGVVVVKLGAAGAMVATGQLPPARISPRPGTVRDTTGAGDAFCAGFLARWLTGGGVSAAAKAGAAAALAVSGLGGRPHR